MNGPKKTEAKLFILSPTTDAPVCEEGEAVRVYSAGVGQTVNISCSILASPILLKFSWVFNNTVRSERLSGDKVYYRPGKAKGCESCKECSCGSVPRDRIPSLEFIIYGISFICNFGGNVAKVR